MRTLVIGLDGATWRLLDPLLDEGRLPTIQRLIEDGVRGSLESTVPPLTPPAWTSISTGVGPGTHGIRDFLEMDRDTYSVSPVEYAQMDVPATWDVFDQYDRSIGVVNFPIAYPPRDVGEFFVSGPPVHESERIANPPAVAQLLDDIDYRIDPERRPEDGVEPFFDEIRDLTETQCQATVELIDRYDPELLWTVFMGIDRVQHYLWDEQIEGENAVERFYVYMDEVVERLVEATDDDVNVCLLSDHGARRIDKRVNVNALLERLGFLQREDHQSKSTRQGVVDRAWEIATTLPRPVKTALRDTLPRGFVARFRSETSNSPQASFRTVDWGATEAFAVGNGGQIFLHTDAYAEGSSLTDEAYEERRDQVIAALEGVTDPDNGCPVFDRVIPAEDVYGDHAGGGPDLLAIPNEWRYTLHAGSDTDWIESPGNRVADHEPEGIFVLSGDCASGGPISCDAVDVAPTLLFLHDLPRVADMEGKVVMEAFTDEFAESRDQETIPSFTITHSDASVDQDRVESRLKNLGYL